MITEAEMAILLNRSLTDAESDNFDLYLNIATERLEQLLCLNLDTTSGERTFGTRLDYRTVYIDPFTEITSVEIDGNVVDEADYTVKQNDKFNGSWYNIIEFDRRQTGENIVVDAEWGFEVTEGDPDVSLAPNDLKLLLAKLFAQGSVEQTSDSNIKSKKIEDFTVTFKDGATYDEFVLSNSATIEKYSQCNQSAIRHGAVNDIRPFYYD